MISTFAERPWRACSHSPAQHSLAPTLSVVCRYVERNALRSWPCFRSRRLARGRSLTLASIARTQAEAAFALAVRESDLCPQNKSKRPDPFDDPCTVEHRSATRAAVGIPPSQSQPCQDRAPRKHETVKPVKKKKEKMRSAIRMFTRQERPCTGSAKYNKPPKICQSDTPIITTSRSSLSPSRSFSTSKSWRV